MATKWLIDANEAIVPCKIGDRERLLRILNVPIYPHENVDPLEALADYLLDNGVTFGVDAVEVIRCGKCRHYDPDTSVCQFWHGHRSPAQYCSEGEIYGKE